jgi:hypothetical protein
MEDNSSTSESMRCKKCGRPFADQDRIASISGSIMGDEHTDSYFLCPACDVYTVICWWDNFTGIETSSSSGPLEKKKGDAQVELIEKCSRPWDKHCPCESHTVYFSGSLD